jgi:hypothetical protein
MDAIVWSSSVPCVVVAVATLVLAQLGRIPPEVAAAAQRDGVVRVIVKLDQRPGTSPGQAQDAVLAELAGTSARVLHRYLTSPFLALEVGTDGLRILDQSPTVLSVAGDFEARPLTPGANP